MKFSAPQIGFDRFIHLDWVTAALRARTGTGSIEDLDSALEAAGLAKEARKKTRTVLNRLWLAPRPELSGFADRGIAIFQADPAVPVSALTWGMSIATYPFFGRVAELVGRLSALQGDCASLEVHRRMSEIYGEREGTYRMTRMVLQSQSNWGGIDRIQGGKRIMRKVPLAITNDLAVAWLIEGAVRYLGKAVSVDALQSLPVLFPFELDRPIAYILSNTPTLEVRSEGGMNQVVRLLS